jgi:hypothetical protein
MNARLSARKLTSRLRGAHKPILTRAGIDKAVSDLERRFGRELVGLKAGEMSDRERHLVEQQIILIAEARFTFGFAPFFPAEYDADGAIENLPLPFLTDAEVIALHELV